MSRSTAPPDGPYGLRPSRKRRRFSAVGSGAAGARTDDDREPLTLRPLLHAGLPRALIGADVGPSSHFLDERSIIGGFPPCGDLLTEVGTARLMSEAFRRTIDRSPTRGVRSGYFEHLTSPAAGGRMTGVRCGHCRREGVDRSHVRSCSSSKITAPTRLPTRSSKKRPLSGAVPSNTDTTLGIADAGGSTARKAERAGRTMVNTCRDCGLAVPPGSESLHNCPG